MPKCEQHFIGEGSLPPLSGMKKHELQAELRSHGVTFSEKWCVTELRTLVQEHRPKRPVGIT
jgi:hypothetical protein